MSAPPSARLSVFNIPPSLPLPQFKAQFEHLNGFKNASFIYNYNNQPVAGYLEFASYESADYARKIMQNYKFPGSATGIAIDFMQEDAALNQPDTTGQLYSQYTADPNAIIGQQQVPAVATGQAPVLNQGVVPGHFIQGGGAGLVSAGAGQPLGYGLQQGTTGGTAVDGAGMLGLYGHLVSPSAGTGYGNPVGAVGDQGKAGKGGHKIFDIPSNATNCLYVDGVPSDATEREIAHIFRPYPGYICARLIVKESKNGRKFYYCFVDFENSVQASIAMQTLQGYRVEPRDRRGLKLAYATPTNLIRRRRRKPKSPRN